MKALFFVLITMLNTTFFAQIDKQHKDSAYLINNVRVAVQSGICWTGDSELNEFFHSRSFFNYGVEIRFGMKKKSNILPFLSYDRVNFKTNSTKIKDNVFSIKDPLLVDTTLKINQLCIGFQSHFYHFDFNSIYTVIGLNLGEFRILKTEHNIFYSGFRLGFGLEHLMQKRRLLSHSIELVYDLNKPLFTNREENRLNYNNLRLKYLIGF